MSMGFFKQFVSNHDTRKAVSLNRHVLCKEATSQLIISFFCILPYMNYDKTCYHGKY